MKTSKICFVVLILVGLVMSSPGPSSADYSFDFLAFIKAAWDAYNQVKNFLEPDPNLADLIEQAKQAIIDEINLVRAEEQIANVEALIEQYVLYLKYPPTQQTIEAWIRDAINAANQFEIIIQSPDKSPRIAYLCAKSYNMLIPLMALMMQRYGIQTQDILPLFEDAIATNKVLIGRYCWDDLPNAPIYWDVIYSDGSYVGKLLKCYHEGVIDWLEYLNSYDIVWTGNEKLRSYTIERYEDIWFYISNEKDYASNPISPADNKYLCAHSRPHRTETKVTVADLRPDDSDFFWRLEFETAHLVKIVHWSGKYLAQALNQEPNTVYMDVIITPKPDWQNEYWYFDKWFYDRPGIINNVKPANWVGEPALNADPQNRVYLSERGVVPSPSERWIIHFAARKRMGIGYSAFPCPADYDGDGKADLGMKVNNGRWLIDFASNGFGNWDREITTLTLPSIDKYAQPAAADYDGDGKADISVKHDMTGQWCIDYAANGYGSWDVKLPYGPAALFYSFQPVPADYDGDGKADIAIFVNTGRWSIDYSANGFTGWEIHPHAWEVYYPTANTYPAPADYDGDGKADVSIKLDDGRWLIDGSHNGFNATNEWDWTSYQGVNYGDITGYPVPGYYTWDQYADIGIRTDQGRWMVDNAYAGGAPFTIDWISAPIYGGKNDFPIPADYDGDGMTDLSVIQEDGTWLIDYSHNGYNGWDWSSVMSLPTGISSPEKSNQYSTQRMNTYLLVNYPNPFNSSTKVRYSLPKAGSVTIKIFNILGDEIVTLVDEAKGVGDYSVVWDGRDRSGGAVPSGVYICRMGYQNMIETLKMVLAK